MSLAVCAIALEAYNRATARRQRRMSQARALLAGVYDRFTEGHDTTDLAAAQVLLESLA
jgi:hypothetical protein